jgi:hypothetical protein
MVSQTAFLHNTIRFCTQTGIQKSTTARLLFVVMGGQPHRLARQARFNYLSLLVLVKKRSEQNRIGTDIVK